MEIPMKRIYLTIVTIAAMSASVFAETGITIAEKRLPNGDSEITVDNTIRNIKKTYKINLSKHYEPATERNAAIKKWESYKFGAYFCFNDNQFDGREWSQNKDPELFNPPSLDVDNWITTLKAAGMKFALLTVKHTSEFLLYDSPTTEHDVANSGYRHDIVKEFVEKCRANGIVPALYYCPTPYGRGERAVMLAQLHELATRYGEIDYFWIDMPNWFPADLSVQEVYDMLKDINPDGIILVNMLREHDGDGKISYWPTDVINGESALPNSNGYSPWRMVNGKQYYVPFEFEPCSQTVTSDAFVAPGTSFSDKPIVWFTYGQGKGFRSSKTLTAEEMYVPIATAYRLGAGCVTIGCAPDWTGKFRKEDAKELARLGEMLKDPSKAPKPPVSLNAYAISSSVWNHENDNAAVKAVDGHPLSYWATMDFPAWLEVHLDQAHTVGSVLLDERAKARVKKFEVQAFVNGKWNTILKGEKIALAERFTIKPVTARNFRLKLSEADTYIHLHEFQLFEN